MSQCKKAYEQKIPEEQRTPAKWHIWKMAWNAAVRSIEKQIHSNKLC